MSENPIKFDTTRLSRANLLQLRFFLQFKNKRFSVLDCLRFNSRLYLLLTMIHLGLILLMVAIGNELVAGLFATAFAVVILRDIGYFRRSAASWPLVCHITDWNKVESLAANLIRTNNGE